MTDLAIALDATVGSDPADPVTAQSDGQLSMSFQEALDPDRLQGARVGVLTELLGDETEDEPAVDIVRAAIAEMTELGAEAVDVEIPQLQELRQGASVIHTEFKFDLIDYLESVPDAPVASLAEILERGLLHAALERGFRRRDELEGRDTEAHRAALVKRDALQRAVLAVLDEHALDALVYPTLRRQAARIGEPQRGGNCSLSAMSGLPAITVPAGFTDDGMPIGLELLGRPFSDPELVGFAFAFEQATHHRGAPATTPPLVNGVAPPGVVFEITATGAQLVPPVSMQATAQARFVWDVVVGELRYEISVDGLEPDQLRFAHIHRGEDGANGPVIVTLSNGPAPRFSGTLVLSGRQRLDLE